MGNKYNNPLDTRNYGLSVPREINVVSHSLKLVTDNINFTRGQIIRNSSLTRKLLSIYYMTT